MGTVITLFSSAVPADNLASIDVPANGHLIGLDWSLTVNPSAADFQIRGQVSFGSTSQFSTNDARAAISTIAVSADLTTSGAAVTFANKYVSLPDLPVNMGERIYLHSAGTGVTVMINVALHFDFDMDRARVRMR